MTWYGMERCGTVWNDMVRNDVVRYGMMWYGMERCGTVCNDMIRYEMMSYGMD